MAFRGALRSLSQKLRLCSPTGRGNYEDNDVGDSEDEAPEKTNSPSSSSSAEYVERRASLPPTRHVCSKCGAVVIFPPEVIRRTCVACDTKLMLEDGCAVEDLYSVDEVEERPPSPLSRKLAAIARIKAWAKRKSDAGESSPSSMKKRDSMLSASSSFSPRASFWRRSSVTVSAAEAIQPQRRTSAVAVIPEIDFEELLSILLKLVLSVCAADVLDCWNVVRSFAAPETIALKSVAMKVTSGLSTLPQAVESRFEQQSRFEEIVSLFLKLYGDLDQLSEDKAPDAVADARTLPRPSCPQCPSEGDSDDGAEVCRSAYHSEFSSGQKSAMGTSNDSIQLPDPSRLRSDSSSDQLNGDLAQELKEDKEVAQTNHVPFRFENVATDEEVFGTIYPERIYEGEEEPGPFTSEGSRQTSPEWANVCSTTEPRRFDERPAHMSSCSGSTNWRKKRFGSNDKGKFGSNDKCKFGSNDSCKFMKRGMSSTSNISIGSGVSTYVKTILRKQANQTEMIGDIQWSGDGSPTDADRRVQQSQALANRYGPGTCRAVPQSDGHRQTEDENEQNNTRRERWLQAKALASHPLSAPSKRPLSPVDKGDQGEPPIFARRSLFKYVVNDPATQRELLPLRLPQEVSSQCSRIGSDHLFGRQLTAHTNITDCSVSTARLLEMAWADHSQDDLDRSFGTGSHRGSSRRGSRESSRRGSDVGLSQLDLPDIAEVGTPSSASTPLACRSPTRPHTDSEILCFKNVPEGMLVPNKVVRFWAEMAREMAEQHLREKQEKEVELTQISEEAASADGRLETGEFEERRPSLPLCLRSEAADRGCEEAVSAAEMERWKKRREEKKRRKKEESTRSTYGEILKRKHDSKRTGSPSHGRPPSQVAQSSSADPNGDGIEATPNDSAAQGENEPQEEDEAMAKWKARKAAKAEKRKQSRKMTYGDLVKMDHEQHIEGLQGGEGGPPNPAPPDCVCGPPPPLRAPPPIRPSPEHNLLAAAEKPAAGQLMLDHLHGVDSLENTCTPWTTPSEREGCLSEAEEEANRNRGEAPGRARQPSPGLQGEPNVTIDTSVKALHGILKRSDTRDTPNSDQVAASPRLSKSKSVEFDMRQNTSLTLSD